MTTLVRPTPARWSMAAPPAWWPEPRWVLWGSVGCWVVVLVFGIGGLVLCLVGVVGCLLWWWRRHSRRLAALRQRQLPEALERIAGALRSGSSTPQAVSAAGELVDDPLGQELRVVAIAMRRGRSLADAVDEWAAGRRDDGTRLVATALVLASNLGAAPARAVDGVASTLRERLDLANERHALATQARVSAIVLSAAPFGFALLLAASDPVIAHFLLGTTAGWTCLLVGGALDATGALWMTRLTRSATR